MLPVVIVAACATLACQQEVALQNVSDAGPDDAAPADAGGLERGDAGEDAGDGCPAFPVPGIEAVVEGPSGRICDAEVEATDGDFRTILQGAGAPGACYSFGVFDRAGTYAVRARREGFVTEEVSGVVVALDACKDAIIQAVSLTLEPGEDPEPDAGPDVGLDGGCSEDAG